jgi:hypothetical protein
MEAMRNAYEILVGNLKGREHSEDLRVDGKITLGWKVAEWMHLAQDRDQWRALANTVMNIRVPLKVENILTS